MAEPKKLSSIGELRAVFDSAPQMKLRVATAIADILSEYGMRATGSVLGSLTLATNQELEKVGVTMTHTRATEWTI